MKDNVTPIKRIGGRYAPGVSGNPHGVSKTELAIKQMQRESEVLLAAQLKALVPGALRLHKAMLRNGKLTIKQQLELLNLTYKYTIGTQKPLVDPSIAEEEGFSLEDMSAEKKKAMIDLLQGTSKDASPE